MTNIHEKIKERQKQAEDREIAHKARFIVETLGKCEDKDWWARSGPNDAHHEETKGAFHNKNLHITTEFNSVSEQDTDGGWGHSSHKVAILYKEKKVFEADGWFSCNINTYLPGVWEKEFDSLNTAAERKEAEKERKAAAAEKSRQAREDAAVRKKARKHFGI